jgi:hypothetical protein
MTEKRLPRQSDKWSSFILNELRSWGQLPPGTVPDFQYIDSEKADQGYALASVVLDIGDNIINIPVVVRDWKLCPMDIMELNGSLYPLTARRLNQLSAFSSPFQEKIYPPGQNRDMGQNITGAVVPPLYQRGMLKTMADANPNDLITAQLMSSGNPTVNDHLQQIDQNAYAQYKNHGTYDVLYGIINHKGSEHPVKVEGGQVEEVNPGAAKILWVPRPSQEDANRGLGTVAGASGRAFDPFMMHLPVKDLVSMYSNMDGVDPLKKVQVFISKDAPDGTPVVDVDWNGNPGHDIGVREISPAELAPDRSLLLLGAEKGKNGHMHMIRPGGIIERMYAPDDLSKHHVAALTDRSDLFVGGKFYGVYAKTSDAPVSCSGGPQFDCDQSSFGEFGGGGKDVIFASASDGGDITAIGPIRITHREVGPFDALGEKRISVTFHGRYGHAPVQIMRSDLFKDFAGQHGSDGIKIFLPATFNCVGINGVVHSPKSPDDVGYMAKTAHLRDADWVRVWSIDGGATVSLNMPDSVKSAYQRVLDENKTEIKLARMAPEQAEFVLIASGMDRTDAARLVKTAARESITAYGLRYLPPKTASAPDPVLLAKEAELKRDFISKIGVSMFREAADLTSYSGDAPTYLFKRAAEFATGRPSMSKEAAAATDRKTVDAVLGLGLADEHNVDVLIDAAPKYEEVLENLTWALKECRVTGGPIPEQVTQKAMIGIENYLENVEAYAAAAQQLRSSQRGTSMGVPAT